MTTFLLTHWARDRTRGPKLPLEWVVRKMTRDTAELYGLRDRGVARARDEGRPQRDRLRPRCASRCPSWCTTCRPAARRLIQRARGYEATVVSGEVTMRDGEHTGALPGPAGARGAPGMSGPRRNAEQQGVDAADPERLVRGRVEQGPRAPATCSALRYFGQELVLFRTRSGQAHVLDAYCPHLGAHLGDGGRVVGETLRCPFHGWQYDGSRARASRIPYCERIPPQARVRAWDVQEEQRDDLRLAPRRGASRRTGSSRSCPRSATRTGPSRARSS